MIWISILQVIGTFLLAYIAIFGEDIRKSKRKTLIKIAVQSEELNYINNAIPTWFYFLHISNTEGRLPAHSARVFLVYLENKKTHLIFKDSNGLPLKWKHSEYYIGGQTIGCDIDCDVCSINKESGFYMPFELSSYNLLRVLNNPNDCCDLIADYIVKYEEGVTTKYRFSFKWDGEFDVNSKMMQQHFSIKQIVITHDNK